MRLSDLLGLDVRTESGRRLGRVHDVRAELGASSVLVTGLVVARFGLLERLGIGAAHEGERIRSARAVPWDAVVRADRRGVVVRDETLPT